MTVVTTTGNSQPRGGLAGPVRLSCEVLASNRIGVYHALTFVAPEIAAQAEPGQFLSVGVEGAGTVLRRPFSIYSVSQSGPWAGTVEIVFEVCGPGTAWLATRRKHDVVDVVGPLGRGFPLPQQRVDCLLVGGGYGTAPLLFLASALQKQGLRVDIVIGAATHERIFNAIEAKRLCAGAHFTTEDGSTGTKGRVTDVLERLLETGQPGVVYACGPMAMLEAVSKLSVPRRVPVQVAVEAEMACGVGVCWTCVIPYWTRGEVAYLRACVEGPCFNGGRVLWDQIGVRASGSDAAPERPA